MISYERLIADFLEAYRKISLENNPEWAVHKRNSDELVKPTIPFIGKHYLKQPNKILVYASAENLSGYYPGNNSEWEGDWLDDDKQAENRHRKCFNDPSFQKDSFFPHVHIGPMNNGCLATAVYYIASKLFQSIFENPRDFYETIAFGNYGKFSIETELQRNKRLCVNNQKAVKANIDYAGNKELLSVSHEYVRFDLETLQPDYIILPKSIYNADKTFINQHKGHAIIIPIYQINTRVINRYLSPNHEYPKYDVSMLSDSVQTWYNKLHQGGMTGTNKCNYLSVFSYLDSILNQNLQ